MRGENSAFLPAREYSVQAVATVTTHDLPTIAGFWEGRDIEARWRAGLLSGEARRKQLDERAVDKQELLELLHREQLVKSSFPSVANQIPAMTHELQDAILTMLASSPCSLLAINQEDLTLEVDQQNLPGSTAEYPNWRRKMKLSIEDLRHSQAGISLATKLRHWFGGSGRSRRKSP